MSVRDCRTSRTVLHQLLIIGREYQNIPVLSSSVRINFRNLSSHSDSATIEQGRVVQSWVKIGLVRDLPIQIGNDLKSMSVLILFVYKLMIASSKNSSQRILSKKMLLNTRK